MLTKARDILLRIVQPALVSQSAGREAARRAPSPADERGPAEPSPSKVGFDFATTFGHGSPAGSSAAPGPAVARSPVRVAAGGIGWSFLGATVCSRPVQAAEPIPLGKRRRIVQEAFGVDATEEPHLDHLQNEEEELVQAQKGELVEKEAEGEAEEEEEDGKCQEGKEHNDEPELGALGHVERQDEKQLCSVLESEIVASQRAADAAEAALARLPSVTAALLLQASPEGKRRAINGDQAVSSAPVAYGKPLQSAVKHVLHHAAEEHDTFLPPHVLHMLVGMSCSLGPGAFESSASQSSVPRHAFEDRAMGLLVDAVSKARDDGATRARAAESASQEVIEDRQHVAAGLRQRGAMLLAAVSARRTEAQRRREALCAASRAIGAAEELAKSARRRGAVAAKQEAVDAERQRVAERAMEAFAALEAGTLAVAMAKADLKLLEAQMKAANVAASLLAPAERAVLPALRMRPGERSRFDEAALAACEGCLREHMQERRTAAAAARREHLAAEGDAKRQKAQVDAAGAEVAAAQRALREVIAALQQDRAALDAVASECRGLAARLRHLRDEAVRKRQALVTCESTLATLTKRQQNCP